MIYRDYASLGAKDKFKITKGSVIPRPIAWVSTMSSNGSVNVAAFSYFNMVSPEHLMVSILRRDGSLKDTARNLQTNGEGVVHIANRALLELVDKSGAALAYGESELTEADVSFVKSQQVATLAIGEAPVRFEVVLASHTPLEEDGEILSDIFILKIVAVHLADDVYDETTGYVSSEQLAPIARLGGPEYGTIITVKDYQRQG